MMSRNDDYGCVAQSIPVSTISMESWTRGGEEKAAKGQSLSLSLSLSLAGGR